ncbi:hypothetical protein [Neisseria zoodegmatis]|uniref:Uncharacterized protein n=1 Tax=Neisseria zoodegmatis TaxID=326523 RepID=A0AB38DNK7_9NEIS|nr:hypothetical protein [Neisseria zoodegmatis]MDO5069757.1 hypothetical protein [Neisseria zoodegmatis]OSI07343.1 hypothetical protein BWD10_12065 [Neisseria zoodegmatis]SNU78945.1 Uncharacterised protein [Neisseria zoodegmatis]
MKKIFTFLFLLFYLFIGIVHRVGEFDYSYMFFLKKPWSFKIFYYDHIGEREISDVPKEELKKYLSYCNANIFRQFPCTLEMQEEAKKSLIGK